MPSMGMMKAQPQKTIVIAASADDYNLRTAANLPYQATVICKVNTAKVAIVTMTIASPCVVSWIGHGLAVNQPVVFTTTGALPTGLVAGTTYYLISAGLTADAFQISATVGGAAIDTSGTQSGVHTATADVIIGSTSVASPGWQTGSSWPKGTKLRLINEGSIVGMQGNGGNGISSAADGSEPGLTGTVGGAAVSLSENLKIDNPGTIGGGGGGGGSGASASGSGRSGGGGTGAGKINGTPGATGGAGATAGSTGTTSSGGAAGNGNAGAVYGVGGAGGAPGSPGGNGVDDTSQALGCGGGGGGGLGSAGGRGGNGYNGESGGPGGQPGEAVVLNGKTLIWQRTGSRYGAYT